MRLKIIVPVTGPYEKLIKESVQPALMPGVSVDVEGITEGTPYIESRLDLATNAPHVIALAKKSESDGYQGIFVSDMDMCGVEAAREAISIPIIGGFRASAYTAMMLGQRFSIITVSNVMDLQDEHIRAFGINNNLASIIPLKKKVINITDPQQHAIVLEEMTNIAISAVKEDGAAAFIFGCTGFVNFSESLEQNLYSFFGKHIPVMDPNCCAISYLQLLVKNKLSHSQVSYPLMV